MLKKVLFWGSAAAVAAALLLMPGMVQSSIPSVYYVTPNRRSYETVVNCTGTIQSATVSEIYADTPLVADTVSVSVGDTVAQGDLLATVDQERTGSLSVKPEELVEAIVEGGGELSAGGVDWQGLMSLYGLGTVTGSGDLDYGAIVEEVLTSAGSVPSTSVASLVNSTSAKAVVAPISGVVTRIDLQPEVPAAAGKPLITISDNKNYKVMAMVGESDISQLREGDRATIRGVGFEGSAYFGTVTKIYPTARKVLAGTSADTVVDVEILLDAGDEQLKPGFTTKVEIVGGENRSIITVPYEAVRQDGDNNEYVYEFLDGKLQKSVIITGKELTGEVEVLEGLSYDSVVVYNPTEAMKEGSMVHIKGRADVS